ncbi:hypothetical protein [Raoultibacter timonensis]|uniref:Uncharacterized protein n=1 Tax=Raoultibacter timonensis TaxID=1907662 RepID=A0ABN6MF93_9ACTN|nr:hypothetical protein [Raoultibacter timonensis]BDE94946.1 hypothetical protein CE91St30_02790 [Raoultibacter timonensis]BDF49549.1 hypothetical protein CE91St31_02790 [Raoultibacter timonensis]
MKLKADRSFSGTLGNAGYGQVFEVPAVVGKQMVKDGYPVTEVKESGRGKGNAAGKPAGD